MSSAPKASKALIDVFEGALQWHAEPPERVFEVLDIDPARGVLGKEDVEKRQQKYGTNIITEHDRDTIFDLTFKQLKSPLVIILFIAGIITLLLQEYVDTIVIFIALAVNVVIGVLQEERASNAFEALSHAREMYVTVLRDGERLRINTNDVVKGDIVFLEAGMYIPADIRLVEAVDLATDEAVLTGEADPKQKRVAAIEEDTSLADRENMVWAGTLVTTGFGKGVVVAVGEHTEFGTIAKSLDPEEGIETPIQKHIASLARVLTVIVVAIVVIIVVLGLIRAQPPTEILLIAVAIAVSVVPEGLPAAVTVVLAIGMQKILARGGLVRNLLAAETLGSTTMILTDKTGTLTEASMTLVNVVTAEVIGGARSDDIEHRDVLREHEYDIMIHALLSSDAYIEHVSADEHVVRGRPIERAIISAGLVHGLGVEKILKKHRRVDFVPFSSEQRYALSLNSFDNDMYRLVVSGAPELLLERSSYVLEKGRKKRLSESKKREFLRTQAERSEEGMRFIAIAYKDTDTATIPDVADDAQNPHDVSKLIFVGLLGFADPLRSDVPQALARARDAHVRVVMVTGDNPQTAYAIAQEAGIAREDRETIIGSDIESLEGRGLAKKIMNYDVFARILPSQKLAIARALRDEGEVVAMTGDGINDAPALRNADIGVAVGSGTEVAKEASDLILVDDSFSIIVAAIEEGRRIIENLKRIIVQLLATSFGEVFLIVGALVLGTTLPILPAQILWLNIIEGGLLNVAFAFEPADPASMKANPRDNMFRKLLSQDVVRLIFIIGIITGVITFALYIFLLQVGIPIETIRTVMFAALSLDAIFFALSLKRFREPLWQISIFSNTFLILSLLVSITLLFGAISIPVLQTLLGTVMLGVNEWLLLLGIAVLNVLTIETAKYAIFKRQVRKERAPVSV